MRVKQQIHLHLKKTRIELDKTRSYSAGYSILTKHLLKMTHALVKSSLHLDWSNADNIAFYEHVSVAGLKAFAANSGMSKCPDLQLILPYLKRASTILEIGCGYGRVLNYIKKKHICAKTTAIERAREFYECTHQLYKKDFTVLFSDLLSARFNATFDAVLLLWSGFTEFSKAEQKRMLKLLSQLVTTGGHFILEFPDLQFFHPQHALKKNNHHFEVNLPNGVCSKNYVPSAEEMHKLLTTLGFQYKRLPYILSERIHRVIYVVEVV